jgi:thiol-disulfide isomerase/thioredoxin
MQITISLLLFLGCSQYSESEAISMADEKPKLYYFGATWCGSCVEMKKLFKDKDIKKELAHHDFKMFDYNIPADKQWFENYNVTLLPTSIWIVNGKIVDKRVGRISKEDLLRLLKKHQK